MKKLLKRLRALPMINRPVGAAVRVLCRGFKAAGDFFVIHWPIYGTVQFTLPQGELVSIWSRADDFVSTQAYWKGYTGYEGPSVQLFYHLAKKTGCIVDVGANVGYYTLIAACANRDTPCYAFEPVPRIFDRLTLNVRLNDLRNVTIEQTVVGDHDGTVTFYIPEAEGMVHAASTKKGWVSRVVETDVPSVTLDRYKEEHDLPRIGLVKMDCEFHEAAVLKGMGRILTEDRPVLITEVLFPEAEGIKGYFERQDYLEIEAILKSYGYTFYLVGTTALVRVEKLEYNPDDRNYLFSMKRSPKSYLPYSDMATLIASIL